MFAVSLALLKLAFLAEEERPYLQSKVAKTTQEGSKAQLLWPQGKSPKIKHIN